jgi:hypothetical protein
MTSVIAAVSVAALFGVGLISWRLVQPQGEIRCVVSVSDATKKKVGGAKVGLDIAGQVLPVRPTDSQGIAVFYISSECAGRTLRVTVSKDDFGYADAVQSVDSKDFSVSLVLKPKDVRK